MKERAPIVRAEELEALLHDTDPLRLAVRGHQGVESLVNFLLCEVLLKPDFKEWTMCASLSGSANLAITHGGEHGVRVQGHA